MESYTETDGVPTVANPAALNYLLRTRLGFDGVLVTDYEEIRNLYQWHHVVPTMEAAVPHALREGTADMSMIPHDADGFRRGVLWGLQPHKQQSGSSSMYQEERIDESVARVLRLKQQAQARVGKKGAHVCRGAGAAVAQHVGPLLEVGGGAGVTGGIDDLR